MLLSEIALAKNLQIGDLTFTPAIKAHTDLIGKVDPTLFNANKLEFGITYPYMAIRPDAPMYKVTKQHLFSNGIYTNQANTVESLMDMMPDIQIIAFLFVVRFKQDHDTIFGQLDNIPILKSDEDEKYYVVFNNGNSKKLNKNITVDTSDWHVNENI